jgi:hypothetical protein
MRSNRLRRVALIVIIPSILFWLWFGIASAAGEKLGPMNWVAHLAVPGGVLLLSAVLAWRWGRAGGALLVLEGLIVAVGYPIMVAGRFPLSTVALVLLTMALPPLASGVLFILNERPRSEPA